jgi:hypothetical protein
MPENAAIAAALVGAVLLVVAFTNALGRLFGPDFARGSGPYAKGLAGVLGALLIAWSVWHHFDAQKSTHEERAPTSEKRAASSAPAASVSGDDRFAGYEWRHLKGRGSVQITQDTITLDTRRGEALTWIANESYDNFELSFSVRLISGDTALGVGPVFWLKDERNFYRFAIRGAGSYRLVRYRDGRAEEVIGWTAAGALKTLQPTQRIQLSVRDGRAELRIGESTVAAYSAVRDEQRHGRVGFYAANGGLVAEIQGVSLQPSL